MHSWTAFALLMLCIIFALVYRELNVSCDCTPEVTRLSSAHDSVAAWMSWAVGLPGPVPSCFPRREFAPEAGPSPSRRKGASDVTRASVCTNLLSRWPGLQAPSSRNGSSSEPAAPPIRKAVIVTAQSFHNEVAAPLACLLRPFVGELTYAYRTHVAWSWLNVAWLMSSCVDRIRTEERRPDLSDLENDEELDLVVLLTSSHDASSFSGLLRPGRLQVWVVHHSTSVEGLVEKAKALGVLEDVAFLVLADHVLHSMQEQLVALGLQPQWIAAHLAAVYPIGILPRPLPVQERSRSSSGGKGSGNGNLAVVAAAAADVSSAPPAADEACRGFADCRTYIVVGKAADGRRPYSDIFDCFDELAGSMRRNFRLVLAGAGVAQLNDTLPVSLVGKVRFLESAPYPDYFDAVGAADFVLAAVGKPEYAWERATSSVPTAVMCGTPALMDSSLLRVYPALASAPTHAFVSASFDGSCCQAIHRAHALPLERLLDMREEVGECRRKWMAQGLDVMAGLAADVLERRQRRPAVRRRD